MAQKDAEHVSMPQHAIATGVEDFVLRVDEMPAAMLKLIDYQEQVQRERLPTNTEGITKRLGELTAILRRKTGHDFSQYKPNTRAWKDRSALTNWSR